ncbi:hypothetical protein K0U00_48270, partial [Paenibacillus sepulcri]|nr:hypothetical protein [Paenibacillus sepulcri]
MLESFFLTGSFLFAAIISQRISKMPAQVYNLMTLIIYGINLYASREKQVAWSACFFFDSYMVVCSLGECFAPGGQGAAELTQR